MILYCTYQMHLTCRNTTERLRNGLGRRTDHREVLSCHCHQFLSLFCEKIACGGGKKTTTTSYVDSHKMKQVLLFTSVHTVCPIIASSFMLFMMCIRVHVPRAQRSSGSHWASLFDSMLSEWLISQCFDLLQLLDLSLVRAWIWHTLPIITWLRYIPCFFFFQFSFWNNILFFFMFQVLQFWYGYFTLMNRLYNQAFVELKTKKAMCYIFATSVWILLTCYHVSFFFFFFFFFLHWVDCLTPTDTLDLPSMHRELFWNMNHVGAQNHVDNQHLLVTFRFISSICIYCLVSCEQYCLMSTELSVIVCVAICNLA